MKREKTAEEKQRAAEKRQKLREIARKISKMSQDEREKLVDNWPATIEGHPLSLHNACMLVIQYPGVTVVGGFNQWRKAGRYVSSGKGSGLGIWVPISSKAKQNEGETLDGEARGTRFILTSVFDISQTKEFGAQEQDCMRCEQTFVSAQSSEFCPACSQNINRTNIGERANAFALAESEAA